MSEHVKVAYDSKSAGLEKWLDETYKKLPVQLPDGARKWIADNAWWLTLIGGVLSLWGAWGFWQTAHYVSQLNDWARAAGVSTAPNLSVMWYVVLVTMLVEAVLYLMVVSKLKAHQKGGWNLIFYASLVSVVMGLVYLFVPSYGFGSLVGVALGAIIGWFFLFQVRSKFVK